MENLSSDEEFDELSERFGSYSLSADVSECESSSSCSYRQFDREGVASTSMSSPPLDERDFSCNTVLPTPLPVTLPVYGSRHVKMPPLTIMERPDTEMSEVELMKERFAKLLLGEDMSGGGKGVCTALAISNAITSLSATVFGQLWKLEPLAPHKKAAWCRDMDWLLCVSDSIVELVPSLQEFPGGGTFEVMVTRPRSDLYVNLPALKKLDAMLLTILDGFSDSEFYYVDRGVILSCDDDPDTISVSSSSGRPSVRQQEKWWLPFPKVPPNGLSEDARKKLQQCKECTSQILKAAMAINSSLLAEMEISNVYFQSLPKSGKTCLGEIIHRYITAEKFSPDCLIDYLDLSSEYTTLEIANRIEAAVHIWRQKYLKRHLLHAKSGKSSWGEKVKGFAGDIEKYKLLAYRAETLLHCLKVRFPGLPQTALDMSKIQHNKDVGQSILESYSRVLESLAFNIMARIDDLLCVDDRTKQRAASGSMSLNDQVRLRGKLPKRKRISPNPFSTQHTSSISPITLPGSYCTNQMVGSPVERTHQSAKKSNVSEATLEEQFEKLSF